MLVLSARTNDVYSAYYDRRFRWAVCQIDILSRLKSQTAVRKALLELPETLDATYERILDAIPMEHHEFARATLAILAAQSDLGTTQAQMKPKVLLGLVLRTLGMGMSSDHFYNILDIREICGCLVTFTTVRTDYRTWDYSRLAGPDKEVVLLAHYTVKEFFYSERTAQSPSAVVSRFALDEVEATTRWAQTVMEIAVSARETPVPVSGDSVEDYCQGIALSILRAWDDRLAGSDAASSCLDLLNPNGAHHLRRRKELILKLQWSPPPVLNHPLGALAECLFQNLWSLAHIATRRLRPEHITGTPLQVMATGTSTGYRRHRNGVVGHRKKSLRSNVLKETSLLLAVFDQELQWDIEENRAEILASSVGWDSMLFAATARHKHDEHEPTCPVALTIGYGANLNAAPCRMTPLQAAAQRWDYISAKLLLDNGADVNAVGSSHGYVLAASKLDYDLIHDSPLRILRKRQCFSSRNPQVQVSRAGTGSATKKKLEQLFLEAGARDFTATFLEEYMAAEGRVAKADAESVSGHKDG